MKGYYDRYLDVNLTNGELSEYEIQEEWHRKHIGGRGIAHRILLEELEPGIDPLGPENVLIFGGGPVQGTGLSGSGRHAVASKSPKTNTASDSYAGGFFAQELGQSGYDGILVRGISDEPVYLLLENGGAELRTAGDIWGKTTRETEEELRARHEGSRVSSIGPAGEKLIEGACIINDYSRAAGRPGFGAVMGSKKLKAVAISGDVEKELADPERFDQLRKEFAQFLSEDNGFGELGTTGGLLSLNDLGILPTKNFQKGTFDRAENISGEKMAETMLEERDTCTACPIRCKRGRVKTEFMDQEVNGPGPEYETLAAFGSLNMNDNLDSIALANKKCNEYGMDTIATGNLIALATEATEKGILDTDLQWGNAEAMIEMIDKIAHREGVGNMLAQGISHVKEELDIDFAMELKGQEIPLHDPRGKKGFGLDYATSPRGGTHLEGMHDTMLSGEPAAPELGVNETYERFGLEGKPRLCKIFTALASFTNSLVMCRFTTFSKLGSDYNFPMIREIVESISGISMDAEEMMKVGERNYALLKIFASREGYSRADDDLPNRFKEPLPDGASKEHAMPEEEFQDRIDEYYQLRGYDQNGPTAETLKELDLEELTTT